jgi:hypothetical protein
MTYRGIVSNGVIVLERDKLADGTVVEVTPVTVEFWESPTLGELARSQNVKPIADVRAIFGTWPGEADDGFEAAVEELRHPSVGGDHR